MVLDGRPVCRGRFPAILDLDREIRGKISQVGWILPPIVPGNGSGQEAQFLGPENAPTGRSAGEPGAEDSPLGRLTIEARRPDQPASDAEYRALETGDILFFPTTPFEMPEEERRFLLGQKQSATFHKNISYRPAEDRLKGVDQKDEAARERARQIMRDYSRRAIAFMASFFPRYAESWRIDFASFRPIEERGRAVSLRSRNDLIHVDNFPSRPSNGDRILRVFTNIHPERPRLWATSDSFETLARTYAQEAGLPRRPGAFDRLRSRALNLLSALNLPVVDRPGYDQFMLRFHHFMKENATFQETCPKDRWEFPSGSSWICFTDTTSHACLGGQYALEQTFLVRHAALAWPEKAPVSILESMVGFPLTNSGRKSA